MRVCVALVADVLCSPPSSLPPTQVLYFPDDACTAAVGKRGERRGEREKEVKEGGGGEGEGKGKARRLSTIMDIIYTSVKICIQTQGRYCYPFHQGKVLLLL